MHVSTLARMHGLSRGTLLHYDKLGLLRPSGRSLSNHREYSERDVERLAQICLFRRAGLSLKAIGRLLNGGDDLLVPMLERRLQELSEEMEELRMQQRLVRNLLQRNLDPPESLSWEGWVALIKSAGLTLEDLRTWHGDFERLSPEKHRQFLLRLNIPEDARRQLQAWGLDLPL